MENIKKIKFKFLIFIVILISSCNKHIYKLEFNNYDYVSNILNAKDEKKITLYFDNDSVSFGGAKVKSYSYINDFREVTKIRYKNWFFFEIKNDTIYFFSEKSDSLKYQFSYIDGQMIVLTQDTSLFEFNYYPHYLQRKDSLLFDINLDLVKYLKNKHLEGKETLKKYNQ